jgi:hypothetical protein
MLPSTKALERILQKLIDKQVSIWEEFCAADAIICWNWIEANYKSWHVTTRFAVHGFHHKIYRTELLHAAI